MVNVTVSEGEGQAERAQPSLHSRADRAHESESLPRLRRLLPSWGIRQGISWWLCRLVAGGQISFAGLA